MKFLLVLSSLLTVASASMPEISADSALGKHLVSKARKLEEGDDAEVDMFNWVSGYSVKFQGCHHIKQWNEGADGEEDVKISTSRLVRFRLCPSGSCSASKAAGCTSSYGDYIIDMDTFMDSYFEAKRQSIEYNCEYFVNYECDCEDSDDKDDGFNRDYCEFDCYNNAGMSECIDRNPYTDDDGEEEFKLEEYMECRQVELPNNDEERKLEEGEEVQYFVGPYCAEQGGAIMLGLFSEDTCTNFAEDVTFEELMGFELPYSSESVVGAECLECIEKRNEDEQNQDDAVDADDVSEQCENLYMGAGKCEAKLPEDMLYEVNNNACNYMEGIRIVRKDGIIDTGSSRPSAAATAFIVIFAMAFAAMSFYVWYLRTRLGVKKNALL